MRYPYIVYSRNIDIRPVFSNLKGDSFVVDMSNYSSIFDDMDVRDQKEFQDCFGQDDEG